MGLSKGRVTFLISLSYNFIRYLIDLALLVRRLIGLAFVALHAHLIIDQCANLVIFVVTLCPEVVIRPDTRQQKY